MAAGAALPAEQAATTARSQDRAREERSGSDHADPPVPGALDAQRGLGQDRLRWSPVGRFRPRRRWGHDDGTTKAGSTGRPPATDPLSARLAAGGDRRSGPGPGGSVGARRGGLRGGPRQGARGGHGRRLAVGTADEQGRNGPADPAHPVRDDGPDAGPAPVRGGARRRAGDRGSPLRLAPPAARGARLAGRPRGPFPEPLRALRGVATEEFSRWRGPELHPDW